MIGRYEYETQEDLIESLDAEVEKLANIEGATLIKCLDTAFFELGITDTACIVDIRTMDLINTYFFYKNSPEKAFSILSQVWFEAYNIMSKLEPRLF